MADPKRWLQEDGGATASERALLREARDVGPRPQDREAVLAAVLARVGGSGGMPGDGGGGGASAKGAGTSKGAGTLLKVFLAVVVAGGLVWLLLRTGDPRTTNSAAPPQQAPVTTASATIAASGAPSAEPTSSPPPSSTAPAPPPPVIVVATASAPIVLPSAIASATAAPSTSASTTLASRLKEESELTTHARDALRAGDFAGALAYLATAQSKFPNGVLVQERRALEIEALWRSGQKAKASALADAFLKAYPNSPHATRVREFQIP